VDTDSTVDTDTDTSATSPGNEETWRWLLTNLRYLLYLSTGMLVYSGIVPFFFCGGAFLREKWGFSLELADACMMLMEGGVVLISPMIGWYLDAYKGSLFCTSVWLMLCMFSVAAGLFSLVALPASSSSPIWGLGMMSVGWGGANTLLCSMGTVIVPDGLYALGAGLFGSVLNVGPAVLPLVMSAMPTMGPGLLLLGGACCLAGLSSALQAQQATKHSKSARSAGTMV